MRLRGPVVISAVVLGAVFGWLAPTSIDHHRAAPAVKPAPSDYDREVRHQRRGIDDAARLASAQPQSALRRAELAARFLSYSRLTGDDDARVRAVRAIEEAFERSPQGHGPFAVRASILASLHRVELAAEDIRRARTNPRHGRARRAELRSLEADLAFQRGRFDEALAGYEDAVEIHRGFSPLSRLAHYHLRTGDFERAASVYDDAERALGANDGRGLAWLELQRGLMDLERGRHPEALAHYRAADRAFSGWWLVEEHIAEIHANEGRLEEAIAIYREVVARTGEPELVDALAALLETTDPASASALRRRARDTYEEQLRRFPEAASGHALEHFLEAGDAGRALTLARANHANRPGGAETTLLAQAHLLDGDARAACEVLEPLLATPWRTADTHATAALAYELTGDSVRSAAQRALATGIHPGAMDAVDHLRPAHLAAR